MKGVIFLKKKLNITLDPDIFEEFCKYAARYGTSISSWIEVKMKEFIEEEKEIEVKAKKVKEEPSVEQNLRNIAKIVEEEQDQLKIIEERTGEFKLDLNKEDEDSFIDEIEDSMSLDELMSLYEKKFKD